MKESGFFFQSRKEQRQNSRQSDQTANQVLNNHGPWRGEDGGEGNLICRKINLGQLMGEFSH